MAGPLDGVLVADFSRVLAGPLCTVNLADLGATVVKVERPGTGDDTRAWGPPWSSSGSTYFESVNRSKLSVTFDLRTPADRALALELASRADVLVENHRPGALKRLGLGYEQVQAVNPGIIYCSIPGHHLLLDPRFRRRRRRRTARVRLRGASDGRAHEHHRRT